MPPHKNCWSDDRIYDFPALVQGLQTYLKLKATPIGMKRLHKVAELDSVRGFYFNIAIAPAPRWPWARSVKLLQPVLWPLCSQYIP